MSLHELVGHREGRLAVARAFDTGRLPQALLLHGAPGVGKQRFGLWIAQLLLCEKPSAEGPCGRCQGCRLAMRIEHPDLHWYVPVRKPPSKGSPQRDDEALEEARQTRIQELRSRPLQPTHSSEPLGLHLGTIRNLRRRAANRPSMASRQVFLVANAEELVSQEASPEAANALLKLLEEPPESLTFILTSAEPGRLLPTIRSRTSSLHLPGLPEDAVSTFLQEMRGVEASKAEATARLASGSIGRALGYLPDEGEEDGPLEALRKESFRLLRDALSDDPAQRFSRALQYAPSGARGLRELLLGLEVWLRDLAAARTSPEALLNRDAGDWLVRTVEELGIDPAAVARSMEALHDARAQAAGNVNPQLLLSGLLIRLNRTLVPPRPTSLAGMEERLRESGVPRRSG